MEYQLCFENAINRLKSEERYRAFANLERDANRFPLAMWRPAGQEDKPPEVTVWCSNDYLGMGGHPDVIEASVVAAAPMAPGRVGRATFPGPTIRSCSSRRSSPICTARRRKCSEAQIVTEPKAAISQSLA